MAPSSSHSDIPVSVSTSLSRNLDVFVSFKSSDTRDNIVDNLFTAFAPQEISTYKYDPTVPVDKSIVYALINAIKDSQISLVIFSENYADSYLCLEELACIMKCKDERGLIVMPIFYHVDPKDVQKLTGKYGEALEKHELENKDKIESWKKALVDASNIPGWEVNHIANGNESRCIKEVVETLLTRLNRQ